MSTLTEDFRAWLLSKSAISTAVNAKRIHQTLVPESYDGTYIWFMRIGIDREDTLNQQPGDPPLSCPA